MSAALADLRYELESAEALLAGRPPPVRRPPCFFDPLHGTPVQDVTSTPPHGGVTTVPACAADAARVAAGEEAETRTISVNGVRRPFWDAPAYFQPRALGFFGLAGGLLLGSALDSGSAEATPSEDLGGGFGDFGGGGDFGAGGDFGGGDLGGF